MYNDSVLLSLGTSLESTNDEWDTLDIFVEGNRSVDSESELSVSQRAGGRRKTYPGPRSYVGADAISEISHVRKTTNKMVLISDKAKRKPLSISKPTLDRTMLDLQTSPPTSAERHEVAPDARCPRSDFGT